MLYWLIDFSDKLSILNVFRYITFRTGGAMITALVLVFLFGPWLIDHLRLKQGKGQPIRSDGPQSHLLTKKGTPTMGGLMILFGIVVSTVLWANPANSYVWIVLGVTLTFGAIGFYDDYLKVTKQTHAGVSGKLRFAIEAVIAAIACYLIMSLGREPFASSLTFPFFKEFILWLGWLFPVFGAFIIVGAGNAVNLTDGLDGLAIVPVIIAALRLGFILPGGKLGVRGLPRIHYVAGTEELAVLCGAVVAQAWAFSGSMRRRPRSSWATPAARARRHARRLAVAASVIVLAVIGGLFVLEAISVIVQVVSFKLTGSACSGWHDPSSFRAARLDRAADRDRFWIVSVVLALAGFQR